MNNSKQLEKLLLERQKSLYSLKKTVLKEKLYLDEKQFAPLFTSLKTIEKQQNAVDKKIAEAIDLLIEAENILEELER